MALWYRQPMHWLRPIRLNFGPRAVMLVAGCLPWTGPAALAQTGGDMQAQILYAWQSTDMNRLQALRQSLQQSAQGAHVATGALYHLAHADYRIALLRLFLNHSGAERPLQDCVRELSDLLRSDPASAEAMILQAACYVQLAPLRRLQSAYLQLRATQRLGRAEELSPGNPRAALVQAQQELQARGATGPVPGELDKAARLFEGILTTSSNAPDWGDAETYLMLGHAWRVQGDMVEARNWIEKALIVAPDFKAARMELALLAH